MKRFLLVLLCLSVMSLWWGCGGGKSGSEVPVGANLFITPSDDIKVESTSSVVQESSQLFAVAARDAVPGTSTVPGSTGTTTPGGTTAAAVTPTGKGVRDVGFFITFEFSSPPAAQVLPDAGSAVTMCDGTRIINTRVQKVTDSEGNFNLCISYKTGGGVAYAGRLIVSSGDRSPSVNFIVTSKPQTLAVSPSPSQTVPAGSLAQFTIVGGIPPYAIAGTPAVLQPVPALVTSAGGSFTVSVPLSTPDGTTAVYSITDAAGSQVSVSLTVGKPASQPQVFPKTSNVLPGGTAQFTIVNGFPSYAITSDNPLVSPVPATVAASGGTFKVTVPLTVSPGPITLTVRDTAGSTVDATLTVLQPPALTLTPSSVSAVAGSTVQFSVIGGIPGYVVTTSDSSIGASPSTVLASGGSFRIRIPADSPSKTVTVTVTDVSGKTAASTVTVTEAPQLLNISPVTPISVKAGTVTSLTFTITGGTPPYTTTSELPDNVYNVNPGSGSWTGTPINVTVNGGSLIPLASSVTVHLIVADSAGAQAAATIIITP